MVPVLFEVNGIPVYAHGFFLNLGLIAGIILLIFEARRRHWPKEEVVPIAFAALVGGMIGARLSMVVFAGWKVAPYVLNFFNLFDPRIGPGSIMGAIIGAYLAGYLASKAIGKAGCACDAFAPALALGMAVGRIGDFLSGEDLLGKPTTLPWGVQLPGVNYLVHPTPLYDAGFNLLWLVVLLLLRDHPKLQNGNLLKFGLAGYATFRFFVEFVRNNQILAFGLTGQQYFCLFLLAAVGWYFARQAGYFKPAAVQKAG
jgi:phosphatidylglycerol---prolipoprotein diacylglyceryl transferase